MKSNNNEEFANWLLLAWMGHLEATPFLLCLKWRGGVRDKQRILLIQTGVLYFFGEEKRREEEGGGVVYLEVL